MTFRDWFGKRNTEPKTPITSKVQGKADELEDLLAAINQFGDSMTSLYVHLNRAHKEGALWESYQGNIGDVIDAQREKWSFAVRSLKSMNANPILDEAKKTEKYELERRVANLPVAAMIFYNQANEYVDEVQSATGNMVLVAKLEEYLKEAKQAHGIIDSIVLGRSSRGLR